MTELETCPVTEMLAVSCAHCNGRDGGEFEAKRRRAGLLRQPGWIEASYGGRCVWCGEEFGVGTQIKATGGGWRAECCA